MRETTLGGLRVRLSGGTDRQGGGDGPAVVLLHGFGAPGDDLASLGRVLSAPAGTRFVFPEAPLSLAKMGYGEGRAWWMIDMMRLQLAIQRGDPRDADEVPEGLTEAREKVVAMLDAMEKELGVDGGRVVLGGFSQGAMLACDIALRTSRKLAGLVMMSGTLLAAREWLPLMPARKGLRTLQSHGANDPLLPIAMAERLRDALVAAGLDVRWVTFRGGHEIPPPVLDGVGRLLEDALTPA